MIRKILCNILQLCICLCPLYQLTNTTWSLIFLLPFSYMWMSVNTFNAQMRFLAQKCWIFLLYVLCKLRCHLTCYNILLNLFQNLGYTWKQYYLKGFIFFYTVWISKENDVIHWNVTCKILNTVWLFPLPK
jgi:hypothetical protein